MLLRFTHLPVVAELFCPLEVRHRAHPALHHEPHNVASVHVYGDQRTHERPLLPARSIVEWIHPRLVSKTEWVARYRASCDHFVPPVSKETTASNIVGLESGKLMHRYHNLIQLLSQ